MHIVIVTPGFPTSETDSTCLPFLQLFIKELLSRKFMISVVCEEYPSRPGYHWNSIPVHTVNRKRSLLHRTLSAFRLKKTLKKIHNAHQIDVIHSMWINWGSRAADRFAEAERIRHIITCCGREHERPRAKKNFSVLTDVVAISRFQQNALLKCGYDIRQIIPWGIEAIKTGQACRNIDLLWCGWLNPNKQVSLFLDIVTMLRDQDCGVTAFICGGGPDIKNIVGKRGLESNILLTGLQSREEVLKLMSRAKILVHTAHFEGFGLVFAEAIASGCHVVSTPVGIAASDTAITTCKTVQQFTDTIRKKLSEPQPLPENRYPIERTADEYIALYGFHSQAER